MSRNLIVPAPAVLDGASLIVRLRDTVKAVKVHRTRLSDLSRQCDSLLSMVKEYSPRLIGTPAANEADAIESAVEYILKRVSTWAGLSDTAAFMRQNEIRAGIDECHRELTTCSDKFSMALSMMNSIESHRHNQARQRDHRELVDMIAHFLEEVQRYSRFMATEAPQLGEPLLQSQVLDIDGGQSTLPVVSSPRPNSADISGRVSKVSEQAVIEGSLLMFYPGEWTDDGLHTSLGRLRDTSPAYQMPFKERIEASLGLQHKNILSFFGHITIEDIVYSVNPWMENGNVRDYIRLNPDADRMRLVSEVASGVEFLHERGIVHGDLCGKNILINGDGRAVVCGFKLSEFSNPNLDLSRARWFAPEKITSASVTSPTEAGDVWSFGSLCLEVFTGEDPYSSSSDLYVPVLLSRGTIPEYPESTAVGLSPNMWELMQSCWKIDPVERPSMFSIQSAIRSMRPPRISRQQSSGTSDGTLSTETSQNSLGNSSPRSLVLLGFPPPTPSEPNLLISAPPVRTLDPPTNIQVPTAHIRRVSDPPSMASGRLPPLWEAPPNNLSASPLPNLSQFPLAPPVRPTQSRPSTAPSPTTPSIPSPPPPLSGIQRQFSAGSTSSQSTSSTSGSGPRRRWPLFRGPQRNQTTPTAITTPSDNGDPVSPTRSLTRAPPRAPARALTTPTRAPRQPSRSASLLIIPPQTRRWEPVSPTVLNFLRDVASDSQSLLRPSLDGSVSVGNLEGFVSRVITGTADASRDSHFKATFLTVYQLFATNERLFEILRRRFESTELDPSHAPSRFNILLFIESWLKKGFEDEGLECSSTIRQFILTVRGSETMEAKAKEIASLIESPDNIRRRQPGSCTRLRREPAERPQGVTPAELAAALSVVEGNRFRYITYWDYVNSTRGLPNMRINVFNTVHDLVTVWVKRTILISDDLGERMKTYEEWIHTAQACRGMNNFSSTAAIVTALQSEIVTVLALTCESRANPILHALARELMPVDGAYNNTLRQVMTKDLIPWLDPLLSSLNSTFAHCDPIVEMDGHPLIDFKQCVLLAEQIDSLAQYSPPRIRNAARPEVLSYVEYSLKSCVGNDVPRDIEARSSKLVVEERALLDRREKMRLLGMVWTPHTHSRNRR